MQTFTIKNGEQEKRQIQENRSFLCIIAQDFRDVNAGGSGIALQTKDPGTRSVSRGSKRHSVRNMKAHPGKVQIQVFTCLPAFP